MRRRTGSHRAVSFQAARPFAIASWRLSRPVTTHRIKKHLRMNAVRIGETLQEHGVPVSTCISRTAECIRSQTEMRNGALVEVATVGTRGDAGHRGVLRRSLGSRPHIPTGRKWSAASDAGGPVHQGNREARAASRGRRPVRAGKPPADNAEHRVQRPARREAALFPLVARDARSHRDSTISGSSRSFSPSCSACAGPRSPS